MQQREVAPEDMGPQVAAAKEAIAAALTDAIATMQRLRTSK
ncbi:hypothetical protein [Nocardia sp. NPDC049526]